jgi:flagellar hook protein FlgE
MVPSDFIAMTPDTAATASGAAASAGTLTSTLAGAGDTLAITIGGTTKTYSFNSGSGTTLPAIDITDASSDTIGEVLGLIQADIGAAGTVGLSGGKITVSAANTTDSVTIADGTSGFGFVSTTTGPTISTGALQAARVPAISAADSNDFISQSVSGGAITVYASNGAPANVQMRWAKIASTEVNGVDRWQLFYLSDSNATGAQAMWKNVGVDYTFGPSGALSSAINQTDLNNLTVNGVTIGNVSLVHGPNGVTQFNDPNGTAEVTALNQNGYPAGEFVSVAINDNGRVVASYNNGQQVEVAQVVTADFNAANQLKRLDGGIFAATSDSGEPILNSNGGVIGASLESSNTDISEEFTKLIVTQQAYAAGTRIVSTADQMLQEALNMVR